jgi:phenylacetate-CoA ligase
MQYELPQSKLPLYHKIMDWDRFYHEYPVPDVWAETMFKWPAERVRALQNERFTKLIADAWHNEFYRRRWTAAGLEPNDIRRLEDIVKLPMFTSDDIKQDQREHPPFGHIQGIARERFSEVPLKIHTSGGTTGTPRPTLFGPVEWEINAMSCARGLYLVGGRPGDIIQIPSTLSLANVGWAYYKGCHDYLGILPLTTGSGVVTSSRRQLEIAFHWGTNIWMSFPEYLMQLAKVSKDELKRDIREMNTKLIVTFLGPDTEGRLRADLEQAWNCPVYDLYGTHEMGLGAFEGPERDGLYFHEDLMYFEVTDVETGKPLPDGETGNLVVTLFSRRIPPMIRFNVRDLARVVGTGMSSIGSSYRRMDHFLGRSDDMVKLRGVNTYPMQCLSAIKSDPRTTGEWICVVDRITRDGVPRDEMTVRVEVRKDAGGTDGLAEYLAKRLRDDLGVKVDVELVPDGSLAEQANIGREGKAKRLLDRRYKA